MFPTLPQSGSAPRPVEQAPLEASAAEVHVQDFLKVLYKRRMPAATVLVIVVLATIVHAFTATPIYEARTRLLIEGGDPKVVDFEAVIDEGKATLDYYQTQYGVLESRGLARRTIDRLNFWKSEHLGVAKSADGTPEAVEGSEDTQKSRVIDRFLANLTIEPLRNSRLVDVKYQSADPATAARIANALAASYIEQSLEYKFTASQDATSWLADRLAEQKKQVETAEAALQQYRERNDSISLTDSESIVVQKLNALNEAVTRARIVRSEKESMQQQLGDIQNDTSKVDTFPAILGNAFIQKLKSDLSELQSRHAQLSGELGPKHHDMIDLVNTIQETQTRLRLEISKVVQAVNTEYHAALAQERSLQADLNRQKSEALSMNRKAIEYNVLARDVESGREIYESLLQRAKETGVSGELRTSNIRIVDEAETPRTPSSPRTTRNIAISVLGGLMLSLLVAFVFEYMDSRIKSPDEITSCLGLATLGIVPELKDRSVSGAPLLHRGVPAHFSETMRTIRTNIMFSSPDEGPRTIVVTSAAPGEGKTVVACNLAEAFAMSGQRVLLIDADLRRPQVHHVFDISDQPGLSNVLVGQTKPTDAIRKMPVEGLWALTAGRTPPNPAELLGSQKFQDLLQLLSTRFDTIIVDTPPVLVVSDPSVVAHIASGVVYVVGAEMTARQNARGAVDQLQRSHARIIGAVLNRTQIERDSYYYSRYYRREYAAYYHTAAS